MRMKKLREDALVGCDDKVEREKRRRKGPQNVCVTGARVWWEVAMMDTERASATGAVTSSKGEVRLFFTWAWQDRRFSVLRDRRSSLAKRRLYSPLRWMLRRSHWAWDASLGRTRESPPPPFESPCSLNFLFLPQRLPLCVWCLSHTVPFCCLRGWYTFFFVVGSLGEPWLAIYPIFPFPPHLGDKPPLRAVLFRAGWICWQRSATSTVPVWKRVALASV